MDDKKMPKITKIMKDAFLRDLRKDWNLTYSVLLVFYSL